MAATRRKRAAKAAAKQPVATTATKPKRGKKPKRGAKSGLLSSLAQYVANKASGLVRRSKKKTKRPAKTTTRAKKTKKT
jgi:hypothetical protein